METIRFTKNEAAARTIAAYYDTPPMLYVHCLLYTSDAADE